MADNKDKAAPAAPAAPFEVGQVLTAEGLAALRAEARQLKAAERAAEHEQELAARKEARAARRAAKAEALVQARAERRAAKEAAAALKAQRVEELVQMIEAAGFSVSEVAAALRAGQQEVETQQEAETV